MKDLIAQFRGWLFRKKCNLFSLHISIAPGLRIYKKLVVGGKGRISIGENCTIKGVAGDNSQYVTIDTHHENACIEIGKNAIICGARISSTFKIKIGDYFVIEESGITDTDYHTIERSREKPADETADKCQVLIGKRVVIGAKSLVTKGVHIGDDVVIIPGSVVMSAIKSNSTAAGNPARVIKQSR